MGGGDDSDEADGSGLTVPSEASAVDGGVLLDALASVLRFSAAK